MRTLRYALLLLISCFASFLASALEIDAYDWIDVDIIRDDNGAVRSERVNWLSSDALGEVHQYELEDTAIFGTVATRILVTHSYNAAGGVDVSAQLTLANGAVKTGPPTNFADPTGLDVFVDITNSSWDMAGKGVGPIRPGLQPPVNPPGGGLEPREWIEVFIAWNGAPGEAAGGVWAGRLLPAAGLHNYAGTGVTGASLVPLPNNLSDVISATVVWQNENSILAFCSLTVGGPQSDTDWTKVGNNLTQYTGALDYREPTSNNPHDITTFIITELGPIIGQGGGGGVIGDPPPGPGGPGGGDGDPPLPGPEIEEPEAGEPPEIPDTGIECVDDFVEDLADIPVLDALLEVTTGIGSQDASITIPLTIPGQNSSSFTLSSDPAALPFASAQMASIRTGLRIVFQVWFAWIGLNAMFQALVRW